MSKLILQLLLACYVAKYSIGNNSLRGPNPANVPARNGAELSTTHVFKEAIPHLTTRRDLIKRIPLPPNYVHEVIFVVMQKNMDELERRLNDVSFPDSPNYGQHMTGQEVKDLTANPEARDAIVNYLHANGAEVVSETLQSEFITAHAPVSVWGKVFDTEFFLFHQTQFDGDVDKMVRAEKYSVPKELHYHVESVFNLIDIPVRTSSRSKMYEGPSKSKSMSRFHEEYSDGYILPSTLRSYYNMTTNHGSNRSTQAVWSTNNGYFNPVDLQLFQQYEDVYYDQAAIIANGHSAANLTALGSGDWGEGNLDVQYMMATSYGSPTTFWWSRQTISGWLNSVASLATPPLVLSISYGCDEKYVSTGEHNALTSVAMKLGIRGTTVVCSSGDDGAVSSQARGGKLTYCDYRPDFPATNPYVTAVGATSGAENNEREVVCQADDTGRITSGGGFSNFYPQPNWQTSFISTYFTNSASNSQSPITGYGSGRGYPDISLAGLNYLVMYGGSWGGMAGTSASAPVAGGFFSNINAARLAVGKSSVGWINPTLYAHSASFINDVVSGNNKCSATSPCCPQGYYAASGWDPATGLGSINYAKFQAKLLTLGNEINPASFPPTASPTTSSPTQTPTSVPTLAPSATKAPTAVPSRSPTAAPSIAPPSYTPTQKPSSPTVTPTAKPTTPTVTPTATPTTASPTAKPSTAAPSLTPTAKPSAVPSSAPPTETPTFDPSSSPTTAPTGVPSLTPSKLPTILPSASPTVIPTANPSFEPTVAPTKLPTPVPTTIPSTAAPTFKPTSLPTNAPTSTPTTTPSAIPTALPTVPPTVNPTYIPSATPSSDPTSAPTTTPTFIPSAIPTTVPSLLPSAAPTITPSANPTTAPSVKPTTIPTDLPTQIPSVTPSTVPTITPSAMPTTVPTASPTVTPSAMPTTVPTASPTVTPTVTPSFVPSVAPTVVPSFTPSAKPSAVPSSKPTANPTAAPTMTPTATPTATPSSIPSDAPTSIPTESPTITPTVMPSVTPTAMPTSDPSSSPTVTPTALPSTTPSSTPTLMPTVKPSSIPTLAPTTVPTAVPTALPTTASPTFEPTSIPSNTPTFSPSVLPSATPTFNPTRVPSGAPTDAPTVHPTAEPTYSPSNQPTSLPTPSPSDLPTMKPSARPTALPTALPTVKPSGSPTAVPSAIPTAKPSSVPSTTPTMIPSSVPTSTPTVLPSSAPTTVPTLVRSNPPTTVPTTLPSTAPSIKPTIKPTDTPSKVPTTTPSLVKVTLSPTRGVALNNPSRKPSRSPTVALIAANTAGITAKPTMKPTLKVTVAPSSAIFATIKATQIISGVTLSEVPTAELVTSVQQSVASSLGVEPEAVSGVTLTSAIGGRKLLSDVSLSYTVSVTSGMSGDDLILKLQESVDNGIFVTALEEQMGIAIEGVTLQTLNISPTQSPTPTPNMKSAGYTSSGIAALTGGCLGGIFIVALAGFVYHKSSKEKKFPAIHMHSDNDDGDIIPGINAHNGSAQTMSTHTMSTHTMSAHSMSAHKMDQDAIPAASTQFFPIYTTTTAIAIN